MHAILRRLPDADWFDRNKIKLAGFTAGLIAPVFAAMFFHAARTGEGIYPLPQEPVLVYPNL